MKRLYLCSLIVGLFLTGCAENQSETIKLLSHSIWDYDNTTLRLKDGYYVTDINIDYKNKTIIMNLENDEEKYGYKKDNSDNSSGAGMRCPRLL